jgi:hypothetical protein
VAELLLCAVVSGEEEGDDGLPRTNFEASRNGIWAVSFMGWAGDMGCCWAAMACFGGQVSPSLSLFYFCFIFCFEFDISIHIWFLFFFAGSIIFDFQYHLIIILPA